jgi:hypothetical protein
VSRNSPLSPENLAELVALHSYYEHENDLDGLMASISGSPFWEIHPLGMRIEGREAVRTYYPYSIAGVVPNILSRSRRLVGFGENAMMYESAYRVRHADGQEAFGQATIIFEFDDDGMCRSERVYGGGAMIKLLEEALPSSLWSVPGISRIGA